MLLTAWVSQAPAPPGPPTNTHLERAEAAIDSLDYDAAEGALTAALEVEGNRRTTLLRILELQGTVAAFRGDSARAMDRFRLLQVIAREHRLPEGLPPRVRTPYYEARAAAERLGPLWIERVPEDPTGPAKIAIDVGPDPLGLIRRLEVYIEDPATGVRREEAKPPLTRFERPAPAAGIRFWARVIGERDAELLTLGDRETPLLVRPAAAPALAVAAGPPWRTLTYGSAALAAATAGVGAYFGYRSASSAEQIRTAERGLDGAIVSMTQREAARLDQSSRSDALVANVLLGAAVAATGAAATFYFLGSRVAVTPAPAGVSVRGAFQ